jgi:SAM-dependent methyltransferase
MSAYDKYVKDETFLASYNDYQARYAGQIAERDKIMLGLIADKTGGEGTLLDIGCSTGNLLLHIKRAFPKMRLAGGELAESSLMAARTNSDLAGVDFLTMDMLRIAGQYDCITANAVTYLFEWPEYERAIQSIANALRPGGIFISFDWYHSFAGQDLAIREITPGHPDGIIIHSRSLDRAGRIFNKAGFDEFEPHPFIIPIDLPEPEDKSGDPISYTVKLENGNRICMRGSLYQPWCHLVARKHR